MLFQMTFQGFFIDLKTRYRHELNQPEVLRKNADAFVDKSLNTDVMLLYPPTHIALAALLFAAAESKVDLGREKSWCICMMTVMN